VMPAGRFDDASGERGRPQMATTLGAGIRTARSAASAPFLRLGWMLLHAGWLVGPSKEPIGSTRRLSEATSPGSPST
jgi:hypothetical protein